MVITGLTRNLRKDCAFRIAQIPVPCGFSRVRKLNILLFFPPVLSEGVSDPGVKKRKNQAVNIHGEVSKWS